MSNSIKNILNFMNAPDKGTAALSEVIGIITYSKLVRLVFIYRLKFKTIVIKTNLGIMTCKISVLQ